MLKHDSEIQPGDVVLFFGTPHRIDRIEPPSEATLAILPECIGYARASDGWGITLSNHLPTSFKQIEVL